MYHHCTNEIAVYQMAVIERRGKKWRALVRLKGHPTLSKTFNGKKAAEDWAKLTEDALKAGKTAPEASTTLADLIDRYVKEMAGFRPVSATKRGNLTRWKETTGHKEVALLAPQDVLDHFSARKAGPATMAMELGFLGEVLAAGRSLWLMTIPDVVRAATPTLRRTGSIAKPMKRDRRPTDVELSELEAFFRYNNRKGMIPVWDIVSFAIETAMRQGEILRITWDDYRPGDKPMILIRDRKDPKVKDGNDQWVPLLGKSAEIIERQAAVTGRKGTIFPYKGDSVTAAMGRACLRLGIEDLRFHDLRHEGTSRLFEQGYQIQEVAIVTGHRDWHSLKRYTNLRPESLHRAK